MLWIIDAFAICLLLGTFCARFRDIGPIVASIMQIAFFLTPVIWQPEQLGEHAVYLPLNPFFTLIEIVRAPLLGTTPSEAHLALGPRLQPAPVRPVVDDVRPRARTNRVLDLSMTDNARIDVTDVSVFFPLYHGSSRSLKKTVMAAASGRLGQDRQSRVVVEALRHITFSLGSGDRLGLIGMNGAGKTTLLRTLAGIYEPVMGRVRVQGVLSTMLDTGLGMNVELTGRENIQLRGLYSGLNRAELPRLEEDVAAFSELGDFMDLPMRTYSAGMVVRLSFALATAIRPQILLMDEWFLAGDAEFLEKAQARLESVVRGAEILVLSTHLMPVVRQWCTRVLWLDQGRILADGAPDDVIPRYLGEPMPALTPTPEVAES